MATLAAVNQVGESIVAMLRARRDLMAKANQLGPVPAAVEISQLSLAKLVSGEAPKTGLTLTCFHLGTSDQPPVRPKIPGEPQRPEIALELHYLLASWSPKPEEEQGTLAWALLELSAHQLFDRALLKGDGMWERDETLQVVATPTAAEPLAKIWDATGQKLHLSATVVARILRVRRSLEADREVVVASRFGFSDADPLELEPAS